MIPLFKPFVAPEAGEAVNRVLYSGWLTEGPVAAELENRLSIFLDAPNLLLVNSGTSALQLALYLAGVRPGTWVISTPMTCTATNTAILAMGGRILWADVDPTTGNLSPESIDRLFLGYGVHDVAAIVGVDWAGIPCDWRAIRDVSRGTPLVRDAAHAFGAPANGAVDFTCYSFQAIKHLTCGDGGAVACADPDLRERGRLLRWFGLDRKVDRESHTIREAGWKYHMNDISAAIGLANLDDAADNLQMHRRNGAYLDRRLEIERPEWCFPSYWVYPTLVDDRRTFRKRMTERGIATSTVHLRNDTMPGFSAAVTPYPLVGVDEFAARQVNVPCGWWVDDIEYIATSIEESR